jgi:hypothetical protein
MLLPLIASLALQVFPTKVNYTQNESLPRSAFVLAAK